MARRLLPFLQKREVMIPKANEQLYFRKFILKSVRHEEIEVQGFEVIVREVTKKVVLRLEQDVRAMPVLSLVFIYGSQHIPAWSKRKALVELHTDGDHYAFYKVNRDFEWERLQEKLLLPLGLVSKGGELLGRAYRGTHTAGRRREDGCKRFLATSYTGSLGKDN